MAVHPPELFASEAWLAWLLQYIGPERKAVMAEKLRLRTNALTVVLENIYQPHNASAVLRTCDCFGLQDVHVIENGYRFKSVPDISLGATRWLRVFRYPESTKEALTKIKAKGYKVWATTPHHRSVTLDQLSLSPSEPVALLMGTEQTGLSEEALSMADAFVHIPMYGFTESLNISVSAAIAIHHLNAKLRQTAGWELSPEVQQQVLIHWISGGIRNLPDLQRRFLMTNEPNGT
jgi:tRNA (guanosine-2'-O-)-methyltransferase